eukprot:TRINITY_DN40928_c0_g1_i1.p1 TRINITY_DN40928_c0_g1~~TRINITY_DN40928_c0_g1_i1.p1  ORF type:complete len:102 (-),score=4.00 TRINITY_DN40928_c0_g1_i1:113-418(-)
MGTYLFNCKLQSSELFPIRMMLHSFGQWLFCAFSAFSSMGCLIQILIWFLNNFTYKDHYSSTVCCLSMGVCSSLHSATHLDTLPCDSELVGDHEILNNKLL